MGYRRKIITLKWDGKCRDCGAALPAGSRARYYGRGKLYGVDCHENGNSNGNGRSVGRFVGGYREGEPPGLTASRYDSHGVYTPDGTKIGSTCGCEDYPCCGH